MDPGQIVLVRFPFTTLESTKKRPALLLNHVSLGSRVHLWTVAMVTSQVEGLRLEGDVILEDWRECHLLHPGLVRLSKIATLEGSLVERPLGWLSSRDLAEIKQVLKRLYRFWLA